MKRSIHGNKQLVLVAIHFWKWENYYESYYLWKEWLEMQENNVEETINTKKKYTF